MKEIKFRGKTKSGEWVKGSYVYAHKWFGSGEAGHFITSIYGDNRMLVEKETVGQYTGLHDKNGKEIYEGDIIRTKKYGKQVGESNVNDYDIFKVVYSPCTFRLVRENPDRCFNLVDDGIRNIEVIGNIYDNTELLKGDEK